VDEQGETSQAVASAADSPPSPTALLTPPRLLATIVREPDPDLPLEEVRELFQKEYLGMLRDRHVQRRIRKMLRTGTVKEITPLLQVLVNALVPSQKGAAQSPVAVTLVNANIPRPSSG